MQKISPCVGSSEYFDWGFLVRVRVADRGVAAAEVSCQLVSRSLQKNHDLFLHLIESADGQIGLRG
jgi:hypothetical protein